MPTSQWTYLPTTILVCSSLNWLVMLGHHARLNCYDVSGHPGIVVGIEIYWKVGTVDTPLGEDVGFTTVAETSGDNLLDPVMLAGRSTVTRTFVHLPLRHPQPCIPVACRDGADVYVVDVLGRVFLGDFRQEGVVPGICCFRLDSLSIPLDVLKADPLPGI